jgi:hypothetical protein
LPQDEPGVSYPEEGDIHIHDLLNILTLKTFFPDSTHTRF